MYLCLLQNVGDELLRLSRVKRSQITIEEAKSTRGQTIAVSSPAKN